MNSNWAFYRHRAFQLISKSSWTWYTWKIFPSSYHFRLWEMSRQRCHVKIHRINVSKPNDPSSEKREALSLMEIEASDVDSLPFWVLLSNECFNANFSETEDEKRMKHESRLKIFKIDPSNSYSISVDNILFLRRREWRLQI